MYATTTTTTLKLKKDLNQSIDNVPFVWWRSWLATLNKNLNFGRRPFKGTAGDAYYVPYIIAAVAGVACCLPFCSGGGTLFSRATPSSFPKGSGGGGGGYCGISSARARSTSLARDGNVEGCKSPDTTCVKCYICMLFHIRSLLSTRGSAFRCIQRSSVVAGWPLHPNGRATTAEFVLPCHSVGDLRSALRQMFFMFNTEQRPLGSLLLFS